MYITKTIQNKWLHPAISIAVITIASIFTVSLAGCSFTRHAMAALRSTDHFVPSQVDSRVFYESGAESHADKIASFLPSAVHHVEKRQYRPFANTIRVYVCASRQSFKKFYGADVRAGVLTKLFLSPRIFEYGDEVAEKYLAHELSHLHLKQQIGIFKMNRLPMWFKEGLATSVSNGGGAHLVSQEQATEFLRAGKHFVPNKADGFIFKKKTPSDFGLKPHMFYRQSMLFVNYLVEMDDLKFKTHLLAVTDGETLEDSLHTAYNQSLDDLWLRFLQKIKREA